MVPPHRRFLPIVQVATTVLPIFDSLAGLPRIVVVVLGIGFVPAMIFAWSPSSRPRA